MNLHPDFSQIINTMHLKYARKYITQDKPTGIYNTKKKTIHICKRVKSPNYTVHTFCLDSVVDSYSSTHLKNKPLRHKHGA